MSAAKCPVCNRGARELQDHLETHSPKALAEELIKARVLGALVQSRLDTALRCGELGYDSEDKALRALHSTWVRGARNPLRKEARAYFCDRCTKWHLTSKALREATA